MICLHVSEGAELVVCSCSECHSPPLPAYSGIVKSNSVIKWLTRGNGLSIAMFEKGKAVLLALSVGLAGT